MALLELFRAPKVTNRTVVPDAKQGEEAARFLEWYSQPYTPVFLKDLEERALTEGLDVASFEETLLANGKRKALIELRESLHKRADFSREILGRLGAADPEEDE